MRLGSSEITGDPLDLLFGGVVPHSGAIGHCTTDHLRVYLPGPEQATPPRGRGEPSKGELLGGKLLFYSIKVALPFEFTVDPDA